MNSECFVCFSALQAYRYGFCYGKRMCDDCLLEELTWKSKQSAKRQMLKLTKAVIMEEG